MVDAKKLYPTTPARREGGNGADSNGLDGSGAPAAAFTLEAEGPAGRFASAGAAGTTTGVSRASRDEAAMGEAAERAAAPDAEAPSPRSDEDESKAEEGRDGERGGELTPEQRRALYYTAPDGPVATAGQVSLGLSGFFDGLQAALAEAPERQAQAVESERSLPEALSAAGLAAGDLRELTGAVEGYLHALPPEAQDPGGAGGSAGEGGRSYAAAQAELQRQFGPRTERLLADARAAVALVESKSPGFKAWLDASGAGNDPRILRAAIRAGRRLRQEGRL